jgi:CobQ-like glutamine amidotransferase family enzyme
MAPKRLVLVHLYPDLLNLYGDRGNILALVRRAAWRGIELEVRPRERGEKGGLEEADLFFIGGGQDREQALVARELSGYLGEELAGRVEEGVPLLAVCGGYQLLGRSYVDAQGRALQGVGLFPARTVSEPGRIVGDVVVEASLGGRVMILVGFENHGGRTYLEEGARPLGQVLVGGGNNGRDGTEGILYRQAVGTYLHGLLPKNPALADWLLGRALARRYGEGEAHLPPLPDALERRAHLAAVRRARRRRKFIRVPISY